MRNATSASMMARPGGSVDERSSDRSPGVRPPGPPGWALDLTAGLSLADPAGSGPFARTVREGPGACLVSVELGDAASFEPAAFDTVVSGMIESAFVTLAATGAPHAVRVWNFLPGLYDRMGPGIDRYRAFNIARHRSFCALLGEGAVHTGALPTASCVGHAGAGLAIHVLGSARPGAPIENPRQIPAFAYSERYGPRPPCFARATLAQFGAGTLLLVGGTSSVLGEDSVHDGSRAAQMDETLTNLASLISRARTIAGSGPGPAFAGVRATRVYHKHASDGAWFREHLPAALASGGEFVLADICREELLIEIELLVDPAAG